MFNMRIGFSKDIHRLVEHRRLIIGGIEIPFEKGCLAHSDGDVVFHALGEALLGSLALGDLGHHFPNNDEKYRNIDSSILLKRIMDLVQSNGYRLVNCDIQIVLEKPKLAPYILKIRQNIAKLCNCDISRISVKAGTNEKIGEIGQGLAIEASAIVLVEPIK